jgi:hypothetical protein
MNIDAKLCALRNQQIANLNIMARLTWLCLDIVTYFVITS